VQFLELFLKHYENYIARCLSLKVCCLCNKGLTYVIGKGSSEEGFMGTESPPSQSASVSFSDQAGVIRVECRPGDEEVRKQKLC
jgi:hypothetical protein